MKRVLHITSGDCAGDSLSKSGVSGEVFVWHDILYDGPRRAPAWPDEETLRARSEFLEDATGGGLDRAKVLETLRAQYARLAAAAAADNIVLWFDACLFDQAMLAHILACLRRRGVTAAELLCVDAFPGVVPFHGLGQLTGDQLASVYDRRRAVTPGQFAFAERVDRAFALQDQAAFRELSGVVAAALPWVPAAVRRWLEEQPDDATGHGRLARLALEAVRTGCSTPIEIIKFAAARDAPPQFWGDTLLWAKINQLATHDPPLVRIVGPRPVLPQWDVGPDLHDFRIQPA